MLFLLIIHNNTPQLDTHSRIILGLSQGHIWGDTCMFPEDLLHDCLSFVCVTIPNNNSIMDRESDDTFRPEGLKDTHKNIGLLTEQLHSYP